MHQAFTFYKPIFYYHIVDTTFSYTLCVCVCVYVYIVKRMSEKLYDKTGKLLSGRRNSNRTIRYFVTVSIRKLYPIKCVLINNKIRIKFRTINTYTFTREEGGVKPESIKTFKEVRVWGWGEKYCLKDRCRCRWTIVERIWFFFCF